MSPNGRRRCIHTWSVAAETAERASVKPAHSRLAGDNLLMHRLAGGRNPLLDEIPFKPYGTKPEDRALLRFGPICWVERVKLNYFGNSISMSAVEKHQFQAEIQQLLDIVIHSLYTDKEIFVRELISNAADACEKLRFLQISGQQTDPSDVLLGITVTTDDTAQTVTIVDTGLGMTHDELVQNLGTIAHSGSKAFLKQLAQKREEGADKKADATLIGQFGVGFYSAFMVAREVKVWTRSWQAGQPGWCWTSDGSGSYEIEQAEEQPRGTKVVVSLKPEDKDFSQAFRIESLIKRYSNFVSFPISLNGNTLNTVRAIWSRNKSEVKEEEYDEFYRYIGHDSEKPLLKLHFTADAPLAIQAVLFVPPRNLEEAGMARGDLEVHLYCKRVLIQAKADGLFPEWLRFLKGVVDSEDLPLNISRETMQDSTLMQKLNKVLSSRFIKFLEEQTEKNQETYDKFYEQFSRFLKEGIVTDFTHRDALAKLIRYETSALDKGKTTSLADYIKRMGPDQKEIYYVLAPTRESAESSPYYEGMRAQKLEVLFFSDPWDEFVMDHLREFDGKPLKSAEKADVKIDATESVSEEKLEVAQAEELAKWLKESLGDKVSEVRVSKRLVESPVLVVDSDRYMTASMRRILKSMNKESQQAKYDLEINPNHVVLARLNRVRDENPALASKVAEQLLDNARAAAGLLEDPRSMVHRMNELLADVMGSKA